VLLGLDWCDVFGPEFLSTCPHVISGHRVRDAYIDAQHPLRTAPLNTPINHVAELRWFRGGRFSAQRRSSATQAIERPRQCRNRSVTRRSVKPSTRSCLSASPVRLRNGTTPTTMSGSRHGHRGHDFPALGSADRWWPCLGDNGYGTDASDRPLISLRPLDLRDACAHQIRPPRVLRVPTRPCRNRTRPWRRAGR
jgi:hypothetical protein